MDRNFIEEARNGDQETRTLIAIEALMKDPTVKHRHLRKALRVSGRQFRKALHIARMLTRKPA